MAGNKFDSRQTELRTAQAMLGSAANATLESIFPSVNDEIAKLFEDRNTLLSGGGVLFLNAAGTSLAMSAALVLHINSLVAGGAPKVVSLASTTRAFTSDGNMLYAVVNRTAGTATVTADASTLPAVTSANQEVVLIAKRIGTSLVFCNGLVIPAGQSTQLQGQSSEYLQPTVVTDSATTGTNTTAAAFTAGVIRLTNASLISLSGIPAGGSGQMLLVMNQTGNAITINDDEVTATAANRIRTGTAGNVQMLTNSTFIFSYDTTAARWMLAGGTGSGSGSGSGINYISNGAAEAGTQGWAAYKDAASATPVDGTGGSPSVSISRSTSSPLRGLASFLISHTAANLQGEGVSYDFTIDSADKTKQLAINFDYEVAGGTFATGDFAVYIYDVTNAVMIQPSAYQIVNGIGTLKAQTMIWQSSSSTSYRLIFHVASTTSSSFTLKVDSVSVGPQITPFGPAMTDWVTYTATLGGSTTAPTLGTNTQLAQWRRVGDSMELTYRLSQTAGGSVGSGAYLFPLPPGYTIDTTKVKVTTNGSGADGNVVGYGTLQTTTATQTVVAVDAAMIPYNSTNLAMYVDYATAQSKAQVGSGYGSVGAAIYYSFTARVPITGWSSNTLQSDSAATRVVAFANTGGTPTPAMTGTETATIFPASATLKDTHGAYNSTTGVYTVPVAGLYAVAGSISAQGNAIASNVTLISIRHNGTIRYYGDLNSNATVAGLVMVPNVTGILDCKAGDTIQIFTASSMTPVNYLGSFGGNYFTVQMIQGPAQIQAATVVAFMATTSTTAATTSAPFIFSSVTRDTTGSYSASTGKFTAPIAGFYKCQGKVYTGASTQAIVFYVNGVGIHQGLTNSSNNAPALLDELIFLNSGDTVEIRPSASVTATGGSTLNSFSVFRVGGVN